MTTKPLGLTKPIVCRDGVVPTIYCTDAPGRYPIHGRRPDCDDPLKWTASGHMKEHSNEYPWDLINVPEPLVVWLNIYTNGAIRPHTNLGEARQHALSECIGRKRIVIDNPEGFDDE